MSHVIGFSRIFRWKPFFFSPLSQRERESVWFKAARQKWAELGDLPLLRPLAHFLSFFFGSNKCPADKKCACGVRVWIMSARDQKKNVFSFSTFNGSRNVRLVATPRKSWRGTHFDPFLFFYFHRFTSSSIFRMGCIGLRWVQLVSWDLRLAENGLYWVRIGFDGFGALVFGWFDWVRVG